MAEQECLILLAHGSNDPRWREPFERIAQDLQQKLGENRVRLAYMEFVGPTMMDVAGECVRHKTLRLKVLPLFMAAGAHLAKDIPEQVQQAQAQFPEITVEILPPIGEDARLLRLVEQIALEAASEMPRARVV